MKAFITGIATFLPGKPVTNEELEAYLGKLDRIEARTKQIVLANNGIRTRHYALDPVTGTATFTNARMAAESVRVLLSTGRGGHCRTWNASAAAPPHPINSCPDTRLWFMESWALANVKL